MSGRKPHLGNDQDIRANPAIFRSEILAGPPEPALHLVNYEQDPVRVAHRAEALEELCWRGDVPALAEDGLNDDGGGVPWRSLLREQEVQLEEGLRDEGGGGRRRGHTVLVPEGIWDGEYPGLERSVSVIRKEREVENRGP